jgi:intracellular sulfur oxidation DsrE/DsrF family protein
MSDNETKLSLARRIFLSRLGIGAGVVGAAMAGSTSALAQAAGESSWKPMRHEQDDWLDKIPGKHRFVFDTTTPEAINIGLQFANNFYNTNRANYGLQDSDVAMVFIVRHKSTSFGYNDAMWAKYGKQFAAQAILSDPETKQAPTINLMFSGKPSEEFGNSGRLADLIKRGMQVAVCATSSRGIATAIARATGGDVDKIFDEMGANLIPNARRVPAGIVAVNRAQERGYAYVHAM